MSTLPEIIAEVKQMPAKMRTSARNVLHEELKPILSQIKEHAPVDTGEYQLGWFLTQHRFSAGSIFASAGIRNNVGHATYMEHGAEVGGAPWYFSGKISKSGKLVKRNGRIWAGGKRPGHSKTVGGAFHPVILDNTKNQQTLVKSLANGVIDGIR